MRSEPPARVGLYRRLVGASLERIWENVLDWEHLPWLHHTSFRAIERVDSGPWGWRARVGLHPAEAQQEILLELIIDRAKGEYTARTLEGVGAGTAIRTRLESRQPQATAIEVEFRVPGVEPAAAGAVGDAYVALYTRLWDEDESMMRGREAALSRRRSGSGIGLEAVEIGSLEEVRARAPIVVEANGRPYRIVELGDHLVAHATECPHMLGPLAEAAVEDGCVRCPWHGYRFDLRTSRSADGRGLRLAPAPEVRVDPGTGTVRLCWNERIESRPTARGRASGCFR
jgi:nitrite reductase/ring-hydroxylating ferredoxin subunit